MTAWARVWSKRSHINLTEPPSILVHVTGDRVGDGLLKWPVIAALKHALPQHRLIWLAGKRRSVFKDRLAPLVVGMIDEVRDFAGVGANWRELFSAPMSGTFTTIIATEPKIRDAMLLKRLDHGVFISPAANFYLSDRKLGPGESYPATAFEQFRCLASLAVGKKLKIETRISLGNEYIRDAQRLLPGDNRYIGLAPGSAGASKRWPLANYIELARQQLSNERIPVFFLGPDEKHWRAEIADAVPGAEFPEQSEIARNRDNILLSIALAGRLSVAVANDAGAGHIIAAGGHPVITLFGHTSADKFKPPYGERIAISARTYGGTEMSRIPLARIAIEIERVLHRREI